MDQEPEGKIFAFLELVVSWLCVAGFGAPSPPRPMVRMGRYGGAVRLGGVLANCLGEGI